MEAGFGLEPLAGKAGVYGGACGGSDASEGEIRGGPDLGAGCVGAEDGAADVVGADEGGDAAFDHGHGCSVKPHIFPDQGTCGFVIFGDSIPGGVEHGMDRDATRQHPDRLPPGEVVFVAGFQNPADGEFRHPARGVVGVAVAASSTVVVGDVARRVIGERSAAARAKADGAEFVRGGGVGIDIGLHPRIGGIMSEIAKASRSLRRALGWGFGAW